MEGYKFRVLHSDIDDFVRDIVISSECTFEDFHNCIIKEIGVDGTELASFFLTDKDWVKRLEINFLDMQMEEDSKVLTMKDAVIGNYVDELHQRLLYEYDFLSPNVFFLEFIECVALDDADVLPKCVFSKGQIEVTAADISDEELMADLLKAIDLDAAKEEKHNEIGDMFDELTEDDVY